MNKDFAAVLPQSNEVRYGYEIDKVRWHKYIWQACSKCGKERWVKTTWGIPDFTICSTCSSTYRMEKSGNWKGGKRTDYFGYVWIKLPTDDFFYSMTNHIGCVREHRLVMAKSLSRNLHGWELVHHKNRIKDDNRIENLQLVSDLGHKQIIVLERKIRALEGKNKELQRLLGECNEKQGS